MPGGFSFEVGAGGFSFPGSVGGGGGGSVNSVTAGDGSVTIGGSGTNPTVSVTQSFAFAWTGQQTWSNAAVPIQSTITDAAAAAQLEAARFRHHSSTNATAGIGTYISFWTTDAAQTDVEAVRIMALLRTVTAGSVVGNLLVQHVNGTTGTFTNAFHVTASVVYGALGIGIGTVNATGVTTANFNVLITSSMVEYKNQSASQGGHAFTGTVNTSAARQFFVITPSANTATTASTAVRGFEYQAYTKQWSTGAGPAEQAEFVVAAPTYSAVGASTFPLCSTMMITGAPIAGTNMTITQPLAFHVASGAARFDGNVGFYGVTPVAQATGGQNVTNNVTNSGSTDGVIPDITNGTTYATDYPALRQALFQLARMLKQDHDQMRALGFLT